MQKILRSKALKPIVLVLLVLLLLLPASVLAMRSANFHLDWFTPLTGTGGPSSSSNFRANFTVGQTVSGPVSSPNYKVNLGYWQNIKLTVFLPLVVKQ